MATLKDIFMEIEDGTSIDEDAIEVYADSVRQALDLASEDIGVDVHMLDYEVLEKGTRGLFGFGRQPYRVVVRPIKSESEDYGDLTELENKLSADTIVPREDKHRDGRFRVRVTKSGVFLKVEPPRGNGNPVDLMDVNNKLYSMKLTDVDMGLVEKTVKKQSGEPVKLKDWTPNPEYDGSMTVEISEDEMKAYVHFVPPRYYGRHMETEEVMQALKKAGVVVGINRERIEEYLEEMDYNQPLLAAEGTWPRNGEDAWIDYKVRVDSSKVEFKEDEKGNVDFKDRELLENVVVGQVLAVKVPAEEGIPGRTITNQPLPAKSGRDTKITHGKGTILSEDGTELTAEINGQVVFSNNKISVEPVYRVNGDVSLETGNIVFLGSVIVSGNVQDNFTVKAAGNIEIKGTVQKAFLEAEGDIIVRQGVAGREGARIESTGGGVYAKFAQSCTIVAEKDVIIPEGIMHSNVDAGERVISVGRRARIMGGQIRAGDEINARYIGAEAATKTEVRVGINPKVLQQISDLESQKEKYQEEIDEMQKNIQTLESQQKAKKLNKEKEKMLKDMTGRRGKLEKRISDIDQDLEELNSYIDMLEQKGKICAERTAFPGVDIYVKYEEFQLKDPYNNVKFSLEGGQINISQYEAPQLGEEDQKIRTLARR